MSTFNPEVTKTFVETEWKNHIFDTMCKFIEIPNVSPAYDADYFTNGLTEKALNLVVDWVKAQNIKGLSLEVLSPENRTPLIFMTVEATGESKVEETVLLYGHGDKQPPFEGWEAGLAPYTPVLRDGKLYGRGGADDGYSVFAAITAIKALQAQGVPHARLVIMIEWCEESGSRDLMYYVALKKEQMGKVGLVICLDSGCGNYEQLWLTTSLRGMLAGRLRVDILREGVHSGAASGVVPSSFRIMRQLLERIEDMETGLIKVPELQVEVPDKHVRYAAETTATLGAKIIEDHPFVLGSKPVTTDLVEAALNNTWRSTLCVTGVEGIPPLEVAGNVLRPYTTLNLSIRMPPTCDGEKAGAAVKRILEANPPYGAKVSFEMDKCGMGWAAPELAPWLEESLNKASNAFFGKPVRLLGEGGSIPFMGMLGATFPGTQFVITGVLGPQSNAHGPNEFLHVGMFHGVCASMASVLADHFTVKSA